MAVIGPIGMNVVSAASQRGGERRGNSLPREGLQLCVAPYFATRGRGDMRGGCGGVPSKSHPGGGAGLSHPPWYVSYCVSMLCGAMTACHHLRGGIFVVAWVVPACRRHPGRRNTGLRTAPTAYRGWKLPRLWSASADGGVAAMASQAWCSVFT